MQKKEAKSVFAYFKAPSKRVNITEEKLILTRKIYLHMHLKKHPYMYLGKEFCQEQQRTNQTTTLVNMGTVNASATKGFLKRGL